MHETEGRSRLLLFLKGRRKEKRRRKRRTKREMPGGGERVGLGGKCSFCGDLRLAHLAEWAKDTE